MRSRQSSQSEKNIIEDGEEMVYVEAKEAAKEVIFVMDRFGYARPWTCSIYERNQETWTARMSRVLR